MIDRNRGSELAKGVLGGLCLSLETSGGIPDPDDLKSLMVLYEKHLGGEDIPSPDSVNCLYSHILLRGFPGYRNFKKLGEKLEVGIREAFKSKGEYATEAEMYLHSWRFRGEFIPGRGKRFFFDHENMRNATRQEVMEVFNKEEAAKLREIGEFLLPYKSRLSEPVQLTPAN